MTQKPKRPPSVWISQIILILYSIFGTFTVAVGLTALSTSTLDPYGEATFSVVTTTVAVSALLVVGFVSAFSGLSKGLGWGRWLTVTMFVLMILMSLLQGLASIAGDPSGALFSRQAITSIGIVVLLGSLTYRLAYGAAAKTYFNSPEDQDEMFEPPPPPTFAE